MEEVAAPASAQVIAALSVLTATLSLSLSTGGWVIRSDAPCPTFPRPLSRLPPALHAKFIKCVMSARELHATRRQGSKCLYTSFLARSLSFFLPQTVTRLLITT